MGKNGGRGWGRADDSPADTPESEPALEGEQHGVAEGTEQVRRPVWGPASRDGLASLEQMIGLMVRIVTMDNTVVEGEIFTYDQDAQCVVLQSKNGSHETKADFTVMRTSHVKEVETLAPPIPLSEHPGLDLKFLPPINLESALQREARALAKAEKDAKNLNSNVTVAAQRIFDSISKTYKCMWKGQDILVMGEVRIKPPYTPESCMLTNAGDEMFLNRVKKVLEGERRKWG